MRTKPVLIAASAFIIATLPGFAQNPQTPLAPAPESAPPPSHEEGPACPPGVDKRTAPAIGTTGSSSNLSRQLSESGGVVCPPANVDPDMVERPSAGGSLRVIPPPGSPGGDPAVIPK